MTRQSLERASQELETLRRSKDHLSGGWDEANRLRQRLVGADSLCAELSERVAVAEPLAEEERLVLSRGGLGGLFVFVCRSQECFRRSLFKFRRTFRGIDLAAGTRWH